MKKKRRFKDGEVSAWTVSMTEEKPVHKYRCGTCKRVVRRVKDTFAPWCVECFDMLLATFGMERMKDMGPVGKRECPVQNIATWSNIGKAIKKAKV